jgi:hypothetical protein
VRRVHNHKYTVLAYRLARLGRQTTPSPTSRCSFGVAYCTAHTCLYHGLPTRYFTRHTCVCFSCRTTFEKREISIGWIFVETCKCGTDRRRSGAASALRSSHWLCTLFTALWCASPMSWPLRHARPPSRHPRPAFRATAHGTPTFARGRVMVMTSSSSRRRRRWPQRALCRPLCLAPHLAPQAPRTGLGQAVEGAHRHQPAGSCIHQAAQR